MWYNIGIHRLTAEGIRDDKISLAEQIWLFCCALPLCLYVRMCLCWTCADLCFFFGCLMSPLAVFHAINGRASEWHTICVQYTTRIYFALKMCKQHGHKSTAQPIEFTICGRINIFPSLAVFRFDLACVSVRSYQSLYSIHSKYVNTLGAIVQRIYPLIWRA